MPHFGRDREFERSLNTDFRFGMMIHSAALVDWSLPYSMLREANVLGTLRMLRVTPRGWYVFFFFG
jgi:hypothetical protein